MTPSNDAQRRLSAWDLFMLALCVYALTILGAESFARVDTGGMEILSWADDVICGAFLIDFGVQLARARNRWKYFITWGWIDLLSSIPAWGPLRLGRFARVFRFFRVLRGVRIIKLLATFILAKRAQSAVMAAALFSVLVVVVSSIVVLQVETAPDSNIKNSSDALWWAMTTITTVGYGDRYPVTTEGRLLGVVLMLSGVALIGTLSATFAVWFMSPGEKRTEGDVEKLRREVAELRAWLEKNHRHDRG